MSGVMPVAGQIWRRDGVCRRVESVDGYVVCWARTRDWNRHYCKLWTWLRWQAGAEPVEPPVVVQCREIYENSRGGKLGAVKHLRRKSGLPAKDAKEQVERWVQQNGWRRQVTT